MAVVLGEVPMLCRRPMCRRKLHREGWEPGSVFCRAPPGARDLLGNLVALTSIAVCGHIQCINTHGGRYGNFSSDLGAPLGAKRPRGR